MMSLLPPWDFRRHQLSLGLEEAADRTVAGARALPPG